MSKYSADEDEAIECLCELHWERNCRFADHHPDMQLMAWPCPVHGIVFPDEDGDPMPAEWVEAHLRQTKQAREAERKRRIEQIRRPVERWHRRREQELVAHG